MCDFELNIMREIKATVAVLAIENSKLRQELDEAKMKCSSYEQQIRSMENVVTREKKESSGNNTSCQTGLSTPIPVNKQAKNSTTPSTLSHTSKLEGSEREAPPVPRPAESSYAAAAARKSAGATSGEVNRNSGNNDWIEVTSNRRNNPIKRGNNCITSLKAVERRKYLHVWRLDKGTTEENLKEYIMQILGNDSEIVIQKLKPKIERDYASFKVGVTLSNFDKLCDPEVWPLNVEFSEWIWFRYPTNAARLETK
ncbi:hypothetical protein HF086_011860 [Spodoptera exigua]|uniref:Uncharacterized protein n=1 Tax=Spodoptera exigua TaxID=7107 RepID=A0A922MXT2_SPOEX|nr:hypothetical protein HF086_011860 [Spodoptera exigua]